MLVQEGNLSPPQWDDVVVNALVFVQEGKLVHDIFPPQ